jgi:hypothetical protein
MYGFFMFARHTLKRALGRRSQKGCLTWEKFNKILSFNPLAEPSITVNIW